MSKTPKVKKIKLNKKLLPERITVEIDAADLARIVKQIGKLSCTESGISYNTYSTLSSIYNTYYDDGVDGAL